MTARTITEIRDVGSDMDTVTTIRVAPRTVYVEVSWLQYPTGERDRAKEQSCDLAIADAVALHRALGTAIEEARKNRRRAR